MNRDRRKKIDWAEQLIGEAESLLERAKEMMEEVQSEEQEMYDNIPDNLRDGDRATQVQDGLNEIDTIVSDLDSAIGTLEDLNWDGARGE